MDSKFLINVYEKMREIRSFGLTVQDYATRSHLVMGIIQGHMGGEAYAVGVTCQLRDDDYVSTTYRNHAHSIARGIDMNALAAEICGKKTGVCKGMAGNMHAVDQDLNMIGGFGIIAAGLPASCGAAFASNYKGTDQVSTVFFGDGAVPQGAFHESMNISSIFNLPVLFINDNNRYAMSTAADYNLVDESTLCYAKAYKIPAKSIDGMDFFEVYDAAKDAIDHIRSGKGPYYLECMNYRYNGQFEGDPQMYKPKEEVEYYQSQDPLKKFSDRVLSGKWLTKEDLEKVDQQVDQKVKAAFEFADKSEYPDLSEIYTDVYADQY